MGDCPDRHWKCWRHNAPFCNRNVHTLCAHFCYKMVHYDFNVPSDDQCGHPDNLSILRWILAAMLPHISICFSFITDVFLFQSNITCSHKKPAGFLCKSKHNTRQQRGIAGQGWGSNKALFTFFISDVFDLTNEPLKYFQSHSYLASVTAAYL